MIVKASYRTRSLATIYRNYVKLLFLKQPNIKQIKRHLSSLLSGASVLSGGSRGGGRPDIVPAVVEGPAVRYPATPTGPVR